MTSIVCFRLLRSRVHLCPVQKLPFVTRWRARGRGVTFTPRRAKAALLKGGRYEGTT